jgi:hypothetical protein
VVTYINERTNVSQWDPPNLPFLLYPLLETAPGHDLDDKMTKLFVSLDQDEDNALNTAEFGLHLQTLMGCTWPRPQVEIAMANLVGDHSKSIRFLPRDVCIGWWKHLHKKAVLGEWEEVATEDGYVYYYHPPTQTSQWEPPAMMTNAQMLLDKYGAGMIRTHYVLYLSRRISVMDNHP